MKCCSLDAASAAIKGAERPSRLPYVPGPDSKPLDTFYFHPVELAIIAFWFR
jgi:hypothetical protein